MYFCTHNYGVVKVGVVMPHSSPHVSTSVPPAGPLAPTGIPLEAGKGLAVWDLCGQCCCAEWKSLRRCMGGVQTKMSSSSMCTLLRETGGADFQSVQ